VPFSCQETAQGGFTGLVLEAQPSGAGWWRLRYTFDGKPNRLSVGTYPEVSLASARQRRREALALIAAGTDPSDERKADKAVEARKIESARLPGQRPA
jgi:hypothetical protein